MNTIYRHVIIQLVPEPIVESEHSIHLNFNIIDAIVSNKMPCKDFMIDQIKFELLGEALKTNYNIIINIDGLSNEELDKIKAVVNAQNEINKLCGDSTIYIYKILAI